MITREQIIAGLEEILEARKLKTDKIPDGWMTVKQLAAFAAMSESHMAKILHNAVVEGIIAKPRKFKINIGERVYAVPHYFVAKNHRKSS